MRSVLTNQIEIKVLESPIFELLLDHGKDVLLRVEGVP